MGVSWGSPSSGEVHIGVTLALNPLSLLLQITKPSMSFSRGTRRPRYTNWWPRPCQNGRSEGGLGSKLGWKGRPRLGGGRPQYRIWGL